MYVFQKAIKEGMATFEKKIQTAKHLYLKILEEHSQSKGVVSLQNKEYFYSLIECFGPNLTPAKIPLETVYDAALHVNSGSLIIANKGVSLFCHAPHTGTPYLARHIGCSVYRPGLGMETVNIGLVGNIYEDSVVLRSESACAPSFLFGSQRCNCCYQWATIRELAAYLNPVHPPQGLSGEEFEQWVQQQFNYSKGKWIPHQAGPGLILMHLDSQGGMGSGYTPGEFALDLYNRAFLRQLGENTTEQLYHTSIKEGYEAIGVEPDSRKANGEAGYQITPILLDWLESTRSLICLSNNPYKLKQLKQNGYEVKRVKSLGKIDRAGAKEAQQRGTDFQHLDMDGEEMTFEDEIERLKAALVCSEKIHIELK
jgi:hypothetical protein